MQLQEENDHLFEMIRYMLSVVKSDHSQHAFKREISFYYPALKTIIDFAKANGYNTAKKIENLPNPLVLSPEQLEQNTTTPEQYEPAYIDSEETPKTPPAPSHYDDIVDA